LQVVVDFISFLKTKQTHNRLD